MGPPHSPRTPDCPTLSLGSPANIIRLRSSGAWNTLPSRARRRSAVPPMLTSSEPSLLKTTRYFQAIRSRPDRIIIRDEWIRQVMDTPEHEEVQADGRIRRWARIPDADDRYLRVVLVEDGETIHNAFFDRGFRP